MFEQHIEHILLPEEWNEWEIVEQIGIGSYGTVYRAQRKDEPSVKSAIKVIRFPFDEVELDIVSKECNNDIKSVKKYFKEMADEYRRKVDALSALKNCPNILQYQDFCIKPQEDGIPGWNVFIRMELLSSFSDYCVTTTMNEKDVISLGLDIGTALSTCHKCGIIHRDIKPDNILVTDDHHYKLGDFGLAKNISQTLQTMSMRGTYTYIAPEVYTGRSYDRRADIYSLGLVLYRLMNRGRDPFLNLDKQILNHKERENAFNQRMAGIPLPAPVDASAELSEIILHACEFDSKNRYTSIDDMLCDLELLFKNKYKLKKRRHQKIRFVKRGSRFVAAIVIVAVVILGIGGKSLYTNYNIIDKGDCGDDASWVLYKDGSLIIRGTGTIEKSEEIDTYSSFVNTIEIEHGITEIEQEMFYYFENTTQVHLPETVETIGNGAFAGCHALEEINLPDNLMEIPDNSFAYTAIEEITIPNTVKRIGKGAFFQSNLVSIDIPDGITEIGSQAFMNCFFLKSIVLPNQLTRIEDRTFARCENLANITIPSTVQQIEARAFGACTSLKSVEIPQSVQFIESEAFSACQSLKQVIIPETTVVAEDAFLGTAWNETN